MKRTIILASISVLCLLQTGWGQVPRTISYQGVLKDAGGNLINDSVNLAFSLHSDSTEGTKLWDSEPYYNFNVTGGIFHVNLGSSKPFDLDFDAQYWLEVTVDGGPLSPRTKLTSSPYSLSAQNAVYADTSDYALAAPPGGSASGDLTGTYPNPTIAADAVTGAKILDGTIQRGDVDASFKAPFADTSDYALAAPTGGGAGWVDDGTAVRLETSTDSVGIGTTVPAYKLDVSGDAGITGDIYLTGQDLVFTGVPGSYTSSDSWFRRNPSFGFLEIKPNSASYGLYLRALSGNDYANFETQSGYLTIGYNTGDGPLYISSTNVGIGTNSPGQMLTVVDTIHSTLGGFMFPDGSVQATAAAGGASGWSLTGNSIAAGDFLGTTNNQALDLKVNGARALRLEPNATSPSVIGGHSDNSVTTGVVAATISGGGISGAINQVTADYGTVSGGLKNIASAYGGTVGGGEGNSASTDAGVGDYSTVGGGQNNTASGDRSIVGGGWNNIADKSYATVGGGVGNAASGDYATVGGGENNTVSYNYATIGGGSNNTASGDMATIGGGYNNTASNTRATVGGGYINIASGSYATVPGGYLNEAAAIYSFAAGNRAKANHNGAFVWADSTEADFISTAANQFLIRAAGGVGIGTESPATALDVAGTVTATAFSGGTAALDFKVNNARALRLEPNATSPNVIGGYSGNSVTGGVYGATIGGGGAGSYTNRVTDDHGTVAGGHNNQAGNNAGATNDKSYATVGGGDENTASASSATVGGGHGNNASGDNATVGGGYNNTASGSDATVAGGIFNFASNYATVGGGLNNSASYTSATVGGGNGNTASGFYATVGGGYGNTASGRAATVPGGYQNEASGGYSFAAGQQAKANHNGAFVWADSSNANFASTATNQFLIRAAGGVGIGTDSPSAELDVAGDVNVSGTLTVGGNPVVGGAPIGSVVAWLKSFPNTPALSDGWVECNGQVLNDASSPYNGQTTPNLNGTGDGSKKFLRGAKTSGGAGSDTTHTHTGSTSANTSNVARQQGSDDTAQLQHSHSFTTNSGGNIPPYYEIVWIMRIK